MINAFLYALVALCGVVLAMLNLNTGSFLAGLGMAVVGAAAALQQLRRVRLAAKNRQLARVECRVCAADQGPVVVPVEGSSNEYPPTTADRATPKTPSIRFEEDPPVDVAFRPKVVVDLLYMA